MIDKCLRFKTKLIFRLVAIAAMAKMAEVLGFNDLSRTY